MLNILKNFWELILMFGLSAIPVPLAFIKLVGGYTFSWFWVLLPVFILAGYMGLLYFLINKNPERYYD